MLRLLVFIAGGTFLSFIISMVTVSVVFSQSDIDAGSGIKIFSPNSRPYNATYEDWTAAWWKWFISIPVNSNPLTDSTGANCGVGQNGPVWYLVGSGGGMASRSCTIPSDKAILIPAINVECSYAEHPDLKTESDLRACAKSDQDKVKDLSATIDGVQLPAEQIYRIESPLFDIKFPENNVFSAPAGSSKAVSNGYWLFIKPLPPGEHDIHVSGLMVDYTVTAPLNFLEDSKYHLTVEAPSASETTMRPVTITGDQNIPSTHKVSDISDIISEYQTKQISSGPYENLPQDKNHDNLN